MSQSPQAVTAPACSCHCQIEPFLSCGDSYLAASVTDPLRTFGVRVGLITSLQCVVAKVSITCCYLLRQKKATGDKKRSWEKDKKYRVNIELVYRERKKENIDEKNKERNDQKRKERERERE